ncbi:MAG: 3-methyl-2-oxobutanoate dehydrogenase subunit VorB [bacterium]|jgi:2-oxoglutarate ferredoxin oxidoreductase subunit alpha
MSDNGGDRELMKGNHAMCLGAIRAGARAYYGYPITPQNEATEYMSFHMPKAGGTFIQAESEVAAINMVFGAAAAGVRAMTSSSSPGISLKQEGISYIATAELPCVVANIVRCGPGLGNIAPHQGDYFQGTRGGGHGDYRTITLAPASVQEMAQLTYSAFDLADEYRNPALILSDGVIGQMMEPVDLATIPAKDPPVKDWAVGPGQDKRPRNVHTTIYLDPEEMAEFHLKLIAKYDRIRREVNYFEEYMTDDAEILIVAYGTSSRVARTAIKRMRTANGPKVGLFRPISVWPFPARKLLEMCTNYKCILVLEMNWGQMVEDVRLVVGDKVPIHFAGKHGGLLFTPAEIVALANNLSADPLNPGSLWSIVR